MNISWIFIILLSAGSSLLFQTGLVFLLEWIHISPHVPTREKHHLYINSTKLPTENSKVSPGLRAKPQTGCRTSSRPGPGLRLCGLKLSGSASTERGWVDNVCYRDNNRYLKVSSVNGEQTWSRIQFRIVETLRVWQVLNVKQFVYIQSHCGYRRDWGLWWTITQTSTAHLQLSHIFIMCLTKVNFSSLKFELELNFVHSRLLYI